VVGVKWGREKKAGVVSLPCRAGERPHFFDVVDNVVEGAPPGTDEGGAAFPGAGLLA